MGIAHHQRHGTSPRSDFTPTLGGAYTIQLEVSDGIATVASNVVQLLVNTVGPGAVIEGLTQNVIAAGSPLSLSGDLAGSTGATATKYIWSVNGITVLEGSQSSFTPPLSPGVERDRTHHRR